MTTLSIHNVSKKFGSTQVLKDISLEVGSGELFSLLGPSGCGKSTLLRIIAGLESADAGTIAIAGKPIDTVPPQRRGIGMVFQQYALWPHMTVAQNVRFGVENLALSKELREQRVAEALELVRMKDLGNRYPHEISGGQQQRVALARALAIQPAVILLDEPLSNLDAKLRAEIRYELAALHRTLGATMIYVTHDQEDALALSSRIAIIDRGRIQQVGTPRQVYEAPASAFTARFIGAANLLPCSLLESVAGQGAKVKLKLGSGPVCAVAKAPTSQVALSPDGYLCVRPAAIRLSERAEAFESSITGTVRHVTYRGAEYEIELMVNQDTSVRALVHTQDLMPSLEDGKELSISWNSSSAVFVPE